MSQNIVDIVAALAGRLAVYRTSARPPFLIAIDGRSGVGKSSIARMLSQQLDAALVSSDDFYAGGIGVRPHSRRQLAEMCIDRLRLRSVLEELKSRRLARYAPFDWRAFDGSMAKQDRIIQPRPMLVLEGVYSNHPDFRTLVDFSALLLVSEPERERRLCLREGKITAWERQWHRAEDWYFENLSRPEHFDVVISND